MEIGRKLAEAIATEVMGWTESKIHLGFWVTPLKDERELMHYSFNEWQPGGTIFQAWQVWNYARNTFAQERNGWNNFLWELRKIIAKRSGYDLADGFRGEMMALSRALWLMEPVDICKAALAWVRFPVATAVGDAEAGHNEIIAE